MFNRSKSALSLTLALALAGGLALAQERYQGGQPPEEHHGGPPPEEHRGGPPPHPMVEAHPGPNGYQRLQEPQGWNNRPHEIDRGSYQHNFQAARSFHIGPYHQPPGWREHHWAYGEFLPPAYWAPPYIIADYWLFALEVPPPGYEWVRDNADALLINVGTGEILQVEYGVFG